MALIKSEEELRAIVGESNKLTRAKIRDRLDEQAVSFLERAPFLLLATASADGTLEVSPKGDAGPVVHIEDERTLLLPERAETTSPLA